MRIVILADADQKKELLKNVEPGTNLVWLNDAKEFLHNKDADAFIDLLFNNNDSRKALLAQLLPKPVIVNSVVDTLKETNESFIRINAWNTFLSSSIIEAAGNSEAAKHTAETVFSLFNKKIEWLPDEPGFVMARVVSMVINEAFLALSEGVSTKEEIDTAMKLGTAYPYGPFEWAEKIGVKHIVALLKKLTKAQSRYMPAALLLLEAVES